LARLYFLLTGPTTCDESISKKAQAARLGTIRDINRQIVLNYVREREPISRAEIARESALQRSTVSAIVERLNA